MATRLHALARTIISPRFAPTTTTTSILAATEKKTSAHRVPAQIHSSRMASSTTAATAAAAGADAVRKYEWLVVIPDKPGMLAKRLEVRPQHFAGLTKAKESGLFKMGGAILEDMPVDDEVSSMKFAGSTIVVVAESRQAVVDVLKEDVYVTSGVWDLEKAMIWPTKIAFRFP